MDDTDIIDLCSSSPPSSPIRTQRHRIAQKGTKKGSVPLLDDAVIELSDSDSDEARIYASPKGKRPEAGPSKPRFGGPRVNLPSQASSSGTLPPSSSPATGPLSRHSSTKVPLFLPSDEENEPPTGERPLRASGSRSRVEPNIRNYFSEPVARAAPPEAPAIVEPPPKTIDPLDDHISQVLEIVQDVTLEHVTALVKQHLESGPLAVQNVLHILFEDPSYPKADIKGKRKRVDGDISGDKRGKPKPKLEYASTDRPFQGGPSYSEIALDQLFLDFPFIPRPHIRKTFGLKKYLYAPTYLFLETEKNSDKLPYALKTSATRSTGKGKRVDDPEFDQERQWLLKHLADSAVEEDAAEEQDEEEDEECEDGIECGCCFSRYAFEKMIQCPDAHLFCESCMKGYASNLLGEHNVNIVCMDQSGCKMSFSKAELERFLTPKLLALYERVKQTKEIEAAALEGLEECPFCDYKVVIENENEKLFRCENDECMAMSCRKCKKPDHLPKSCKEVEEDKVLDGRHAIEEAMTQALMRNCPKCQRAFVKEMGCNKMSCPNCGALSCYVCRQLIFGYEHFNQSPGGVAQPASSSRNKCPLHDDVESRHADEVTEAAKKALEKYKEEHPDVDDKGLKVDLPPPVAPKPDPLALPRRLMALPGRPFHPPVPMPQAHLHVWQIHQQQQQQQQQLLQQHRAAVAAQVQQQQQQALALQRAAVQRQRAAAQLQARQARAKRPTRKKVKA